MNKARMTFRFNQDPPRGLDSGQETTKKAEQTFKPMPGREAAPVQAENGMPPRHEPIEDRPEKNCMSYRDKCRGGRILFIKTSLGMK